jgi:hypothetical protein
MWVTDDNGGETHPSHILRITPSEKVKEFPVEDFVNQVWGLVTGPLAITAGPEGKMWFTDDRGDEPVAGHFALIGSVTPEGVVSKFPLPSGKSTQLPGVSRPAGIATGSDGALWFAEQGTNSNGQHLIGRMTTGGQVTYYAIPTPAAVPTSVVLGSDGNIWFTEPGANKIGRITPQGSITEFPVPDVSAGLHAAVLGPDGNIWFTAPEGVLGWITPSGVVRTTRPELVLGAAPMSLGGGSGQDLLFTEPRRFEYEGTNIWYVGEFFIPLTPVNTGAPTLTGSAAPGQALATSTGSWANEPTSFSYRWQRCDAAGSGCENLPGDVAAVHAVTETDVGHTLRASVTGANAAGESSAASSPSAIIQSAAGPPPPRKLPVVGATMTWHFRPGRHYTSVRSLVVHGLAGHATIETSCSGGGCALARSAARRLHGHACRGRCSVRDFVGAREEVSVAAMFASMRLTPASKIRISIIEPEHFGRSYTFVIHARHAPSVALGCLSPGSFSVRASC